jgi:hypothetical protein
MSQRLTIDNSNNSFMAHPETLLPMPEVDDPLERFVFVVKFYLSGWHIKPPYVSPPLKAKPFRRLKMRGN